MNKLTLPSHVDPTMISAYLRDPAVFVLQYILGWKAKHDDCRWHFGHLRQSAELMLIQHHSKGTPKDEALELTLRALIDDPRFTRMAMLYREQRWVMGPDQLIAACVAWCDTHWDSLHAFAAEAIESQFSYEIYSGQYVCCNLDAIGRNALADPIVVECKSTSSGCDQQKIATYRYGVQGRTYTWAARMMNIDQVRYAIWEVARDPLNYKFHVMPIVEDDEMIYEWGVTLSGIVRHMEAYVDTCWWWAEPIVVDNDWSHPIPWNVEAPLRRGNAWYSLLTAPASERGTSLSRNFEKQPPWNPMDPRREVSRLI